MADHSDLVAEIASVEKMNTPDRLKHAKKRRSQQLKRWANYEKQLEKEQSKKRKQSGQSKRSQNNRKRGVRFVNNIRLLEAAARNDVEEVRKLLMAGVSPDVTNEDGLTALHQCCIDDSEEMLKLLLEFGATVNARDSELWTPLHAAATCGHVHLCKHLIDKGAELLAVNADGNMPYDICEDEVTLDYVETEMAKRGITQEEIDSKRLETEKQMLADLKKLASRGKDLDFRDANGATPLHIAAANGFIDVLEFLLDNHVSIDIRDHDSWQPIHAAACWLQPESLEILVHNGADLVAKTRNGETPFDLCEDPDIKQKILDMKDQIETNRASRSNDPHKRHKISTRGSYSSPQYSSNTSLEKVPHPHSRPQNAIKQPQLPSASIRRTSMRGEKSPLFMKEAKEEALHFGLIQSMSNGDDDADNDEDKENKENLPATNIDDVKISIIDDELDKKEKPRSKVVDKPQTSNKENTKDNVQSSRQSAHSSSEKQTPRVSSGENNNQEKPKRENVREKRKETEVSGHVLDKPKPQNNRERSNSPRESNERQSPREQQVPREQRAPRDNRGVENADKPVQPVPKAVAELSGEGKQVGRTPSFRKHRDSQRRSIDATNDANQVRYPAGGVPVGTLADLKKQRAEQNKHGHVKDNGVDAQVQNLFLHSLTSTDHSRYSSSSISPPRVKDKNVHNGQNNNVSPPPTYIHDQGPLRKFSSPNNVPVIGGDDDKFKTNCCVLM